MISFIEDDNDEIQTVYAGDHKVVFLVKSPLYFVAVSKTNESENELKNQLEYLYQQILAILTSKIIEIFKKKSSFDLRNLLGGTDNVYNL
jgi:vacuolar fusion protein MON1